MLFPGKSPIAASQRFGPQPTAIRTIEQPGRVPSFGSARRMIGMALSLSPSRRRRTRQCSTMPSTSSSGPAAGNVGRMSGISSCVSHRLSTRVISHGMSTSALPEIQAINVSSRDRALLMLFLFSDVGEADAPTRIRVGSHKHVARLLAPAGEDGITYPQLAEVGAGQEIALATGEAGTVYLCHPFLVHAAQAHRGTTPRFMSQPPLAPATPLRLQRDDGAYSPVEIAIRDALQKS
jgi:hypothetical protein